MAKKKSVPKSPEQRLLGAARGGHANVLRALFRETKVDLNFQDDEEHLPLWESPGLGEYWWTEIKPAPVRTGKSGNTALMWALQCGRMAAAEALLDMGSNPAITNIMGDNSLHLLGSSTEHLVGRMVAAGANINAQNAWGVTPLMRAVYDGDEDVVNELIKHGADLSIKQNSGLTALDIAHIYDDYYQSGARMTDCIQAALARRADAEAEKQRQAEQVRLREHFAAVNAERLKNLQAIKPEKIVLRKTGPKNRR